MEGNGNVLGENGEILEDESILDRNGGVLEGTGRS